MPVSSPSYDLAEGLLRVLDRLVDRSPTLTVAVLAVLCWLPWVLLGLVAWRLMG